MSEWHFSWLARRVIAFNAEGQTIYKKRKELRFLVTPWFSFVSSEGLEPSTHWLRVSCSTNWARKTLLFEIFIFASTKRAYHLYSFLKKALFFKSGCKGIAFFWYSQEICKKKVKIFDEWKKKVKFARLNIGLHLFLKIQQNKAHHWCSISVI